jgi:hypothetical protein
MRVGGQSITKIETGLVQFYDDERVFTSERALSSLGAAKWRFTPTGKPERRQCCSPADAAPAEGISRYMLTASFQDTWSADCGVDVAGS